MPKMSENKNAVLRRPGALRPFHRYGQDAFIKFPHGNFNRAVANSLQSILIQLQQEGRAHGELQNP